MNAKTLFISYSHDSEEHRERVLALSQRLRADGINTLLDQYVNGSPPQGWPRWMLDQVDAADNVLVVCTETYYRRFRGHEQPGKGKGADWEGALITQELYDSSSRTSKFVPVFFTAPFENWIPEPLRSRTYYALTSESDYLRLYDFLLDQAGVEPLPVGVVKTRPRRKATALNFAEPAVSKPAGELISPLEFVDDKVREGAMALDRARANKSLNMRTLMGILDRLFERNTFRWEPSIADCVTKEWDYRLHSAVQTLRLIEDYEAFVEAEAHHALERYRELAAEVSRYCQRMAAYLFEPAVGLSELRIFVGTPEFIKKVQKKRKKFSGDVDAKTCRKIDPHLKNSIRQMKALHDEFCGPLEFPPASSDKSPRSKNDAKPGSDPYRLGLRYLAEQNFDRALDELGKAIERDPTLALAYYNRGLTHYFKHQDDQAVEDFDHALELGFADAILFRNRANAYSRIGDVERALADYAQAVALEPENALAYLNRGEIYENTLQKDLASADYKTVLRLVSEPQFQEEARRRLIAMGIAIPQP